MSVRVQIWVNGRSVEASVDDRLLLADFLREDLNLTGTHLGCEHGVCGACTVLVDGRAARSCLMLAAQADGCRIVTIEGLASPARARAGGWGLDPTSKEGLAAPGGELHPMQQAFRECHGLQCGFCTPGMVLAAIDLLQDNPDPTEAEIREGMSGNLCRCTGYVGIVRAIQSAADKLREGATSR